MKKPIKHINNIYGYVRVSTEERPDRDWETID